MNSRLLFSFFIVAIGIVAPGQTVAEEPAAFPGTRSEWNGFDRYDFEVAGKQVLVVCPDKPAAGRPWVWHGEFFGHKPAPDIALLKQGFHVVYMRVPDMLGSPHAVKYWSEFYSELTKKYGLAKKASLVGLSRGGLYCYNWAIANPDKVACIYGDAPVCDFKSWPGGKGKGKGSDRDWKLVLEQYGFGSDAEAMKYAGNPVDKLESLARAGVPLLNVYGDADEVVPWDENTGVIAKRYRALGGTIQLIGKPGVGHHPHGLDDPTPIVHFIVKYGSLSIEPPTYAPAKAVPYRIRNGLGNTIEKLRDGKDVKVAYLGGSITAAPGWRIKSREWLSREYPNATVSEINAAIGGTGSDLGVFRLHRDALRHNPDLLFVEFAVNDGGAAPERIWRAMEGIVRQTWAQDPLIDICFVYTFRVGYEKELRSGMCPRAASAMEMLAEHYGIPSINVATKIVDLEQQAKLVFVSDKATDSGVVRFSTDGVHPLDEGHQIYTDCIAEAIRQAAVDHPPVDHSTKLTTSFIADHWQDAKMVPITDEMLSDEWTQLSEDASLAKQFGARMGTLWESNEPGSTIQFRLRGSMVKLYDLLGPDGGQVVITVDGETREKPIARFDSYCTYHRIATLSIADNLDAQLEHDIRIEIHPDQPNREPVAFRLKDPETELKSAKYQGTRIRVSQILVLGEVIQP